MDKAGLVAGPGGTGTRAVGLLHDALAAALGTGSGPGLVMLAPGEALAAARARITQPLDGVDVVIATSGSTDGRGHLVGLGLPAMLASARATLARLGGPGQWLTSLPVHHVAGFQVVLRSAVAGIPPMVHTPDGSFGAAALADSIARLEAGVPHYLSLVPTQLARLLEQDPRPLTAFRAILVGGAPLPSVLADRARRAGVRLVTTYGMTETSGGCVYDGEPLDGVRVRVVDGRVHLAGPVLATRYLDTARQPFATDPDGTRWLVTNDLGELTDGRLRVSGRADDVIISGGVNVDPLQVEEALAVLPGRWIVVGVPDPEWGQLVVAVTDAGPGLDAVRAATASLAPAARPRAVCRLPELPHRGPGKLDRRAAATAAGRALVDGLAERHP